MIRRPTLVLAAALALSVAGTAAGAINVGVTLSATGPAASLGIPEKNTFELIGRRRSPDRRSTSSSSTTSRTRPRRSRTPASSSPRTRSTSSSARRSRPTRWRCVDVVAEAEVPMISMAASARIVDPDDPKTRWVFKTPQNDSLMADAIAVHMKRQRREDDGLHRLRRRLRRRLARTRCEHSAADRRHQASSPRKSTTATTPRSPGRC